LGEKREFVIVGTATVIWSIWKTRNLACFDKKWPDEPFSVVLNFLYINTLSLLQVKEGARNRLEFYAKVLEKVAKEAFGARRCWAAWTPRLTM
jgi:hypothetical protein